MTAKPRFSFAKRLYQTVHPFIIYSFYASTFWKGFKAHFITYSYSKSPLNVVDRFLETDFKRNDVQGYQFYCRLIDRHKS